MKTAERIFSIRLPGKAGLQLRGSKTVIPILVSLALLSGTSEAQTATPLAQKPEVAGALQVLDKWIQATLTSREDPGLSIGIVYDQDLIWSKGYGFANLERKLPATPSTLYRIASISKVFTA